MEQLFLFQNKGKVSKGEKSYEYSYVNFIKMLQRRKLDTRSMFRSVRYRVNRGESIRTADPSSCNFRIKRNSCLESTLYRTNVSNPTQDSLNLEIKQLAKTDYLKSFNSMMERTQRAPREKRMQQQVSFFEDARVLLPDFQTHQKQVQQSEHSLLTPFIQPFTHVKLLYSNAHAQLKSQQNTCDEIRAGLRRIKEQKTKGLNDVMNYGLEQISNIRAVLRKNQIQQQEKKLKTKRQMDTLEKQHGDNRKKFEQITERSSGMQITIFNSTPYDLKQREEFGEVYI